MGLTKGYNNFWAIGGLAALLIGYQFYRPSSYWNSKKNIPISKTSDFQGQGQTKSSQSEKPALNASKENIPAFLKADSTPRTLGRELSTDESLKDNIMNK
ncbi:unnamed protein product [Blepharisma stoltei]|uniref:Uncharacterized protein n=1 Tax=Blepharisma stoltei TaxID=1481888 RepID=A0AAU9IQP7_9CILI|nr:unnamed protein product [Blepharisma stoltei]